MNATTDKPNVLLICTDHWGARFSRPAGHPVVMTPTIDQLARNGTMFTNAYSAEPTCIPARRSLMTGTTARTHGDRTFKERLPMPNLPTMAQCFRDAGYQAYAVGKLHVHPQRDRIGFDEVILNEEGRHHLGDTIADDWELYLQDRGFAGQEYATGVCNNDMMVVPWHLPDDCHPTNWTARQMCRTIQRRDPRKPAFWYLSFIGPHQPYWPLRDYLDQYQHIEVDRPQFGDWSRDFDNLPIGMKQLAAKFAITGGPQHEIDLARRAFYAMITHIDHQIRIVIGTLREQGLLDNTIIAFTADHGEMLGDHHQWAKSQMYEGSAKVPLIISTPRPQEVLGHKRKDDRLVALRDVMPTLLDLCGIDIPETVEGHSLAGTNRREHLYGEHSENVSATRMIRDERYKLVYWPVGNVVQLFDIDNDPNELRNLADDPTLSGKREQLTKLLIEHMYHDDVKWVRDGKLVGEPAPDFVPYNTRALLGQRGLRAMGTWQHNTMPDD